MNSIGNPFDATIAVASIIFSGMLDELPDLKVCIAHGGGAAPYIAGRIDRGYEMREPARSAIPNPPSSYLSRLYYDTILHDEGSLQFLVDKVGADRVLAGSDCPYQLVDAGDPRPLERIASLDATPEQRAAIAGGNALGVMGG
jgi:aminocarboxymuconate-semialdehyde decarboxylase